MATALITKTPGVCGGVACIAGTRVPVWSIEAMRRQGLTPEQIRDAYDYGTITDRQVFAAFGYADGRKAEIEVDLREVRPAFVPECCPKTQSPSELIVWKEADNFAGPDRAGWCLAIHSGGDVSFERVTYCPFCGAPLDVNFGTAPKVLKEGES